MGLTLSWAVVQNAGESKPAAPTEPRLRLVGETDGWVVFHGSDEDPDQVSSQLALVRGQPAIAGWVYDSDFAYLAGSTSNGLRAFQLVLGEPYDDGGQEPGLISDLMAGRTTGSLARSADEMSAWSEVSLGHPVAAAELLEIVSRNDTFVEDTLADLFRALGVVQFSAVVGTLAS